MDDAVAGMKKVAIATLGLAMQTYQKTLEQEQELLSLVSDIVMDTFAAESAWLRASAVQASPSAAHTVADLHQAAAEVIIHDAAARVEQHARVALNAMTSGDTQKIMSAALKKLLKTPVVNTIDRRRTLADAAKTRGGYPLNA